MGDGEPRTAAGPLATLDSDALTEAIRAYRAALDQHRVTIDRLNVYPVPDGDTGTNMALTLAAVSEELLRSGTGRADICRAISHGALMGARGNSGVIVSQLLRGLAATLAPNDDHPEAEPPIDAELLVRGLVAASTAADSAVMRPVEGTILSVARASARAASHALGTHASDDVAALAVVLESAKRAGQAALEATPQQLPVLADAGVVDAGAAGYLLLLDAFLSVVDGRPLPDSVDLPDEVAAVIAHGNAGASLPSVAVDPVAEQRAELHSHLDGDDGDHDAHDPSGTRYEVMFLLAAPDENIDDFKVAWDSLGDSIVMVGGDGLWNCHIHTDDIGPVIEAGIDAGRPHRIQITDLHEQVAELGAHGAHSAHAGQHGAHSAHAGQHGAHSAHAGQHGAHSAHAGQHGAHAGPSDEAPQRLTVECAVVAVSPAAGLDELFASLGCHELVTGGQTMNPSTAEVLAAIEAAPSQHVVVLPNNSNIVPVAQQAGGHTSKTVAVVPTTSVPAGLAALIGFDPDASADANAASMSDAADAVLAGEVTQAVRETSGPTGQVAVGEWIGLNSDGIAASGDTPAVAAVELLATMLQPTHEILTLIEGAGAHDAHTIEVVSWLAERWPEVEIERHVGGQDHYPYLFGIE